MVAARAVGIVTASTRVLCPTDGKDQTKRHFDRTPDFDFLNDFSQRSSALHTALRQNEGTSSLPSALPLISRISEDLARSTDHLPFSVPLAAHICLSVPFARNASQFTISYSAPTTPWHANFDRSTAIGEVRHGVARQAPNPVTA